MIRVYCDVCGKQLDTIKNVDITLYHEGDFHSEEVTFEMDLCDEHYEQISKQAFMSTANFRTE